MEEVTFVSLSIECHKQQAGNTQDKGSVQNLHKLTLCHKSVSEITLHYWVCSQITGKQTHLLIL